MLVNNESVLDQALITSAQEHLEVPPQFAVNAFKQGFGESAVNESQAVCLAHGLTLEGGVNPPRD